eukprot:660518-Prymnesium_polylepis.1
MPVSRSFHEVAGFVGMVVSAGFIALYAVLGKILLTRSFDATVFLAHRQVLASVVMLPIAWCKDGVRLPQRSQWGRLAALSILFTANIGGFIAADNPGHVAAARLGRHAKASAWRGVPVDHCRHARLCRRRARHSHRAPPGGTRHSHRAPPGECDGAFAQCHDQPRLAGGGGAQAGRRPPPNARGARALGTLRAGDGRALRAVPLVRALRPRPEVAPRGSARLLCRLMDGVWPAARHNDRLPAARSPNAPHAPPRLAPQHPGSALLCVTLSAATGPPERLWDLAAYTPSDAYILLYAALCGTVR